MSFLSSLFSGKSATPEEEKQKQDNKNFEILKFDGLRAARMGRLDYAILCYQKALALKPDFEVKQYLSQAYVQGGMLDEARTQLEEMAAEEPTHIPSLLMLANVCFMLEDYEAMAAAAERATRIDASNSVAFCLWAKADKGMQNELMCVAHLTQAIAVDASNVEALLMRGEILLQMGQLDEARKDVEAVLALSQEEEAMQLNARILAAEGRVEESETLLRQLVTTYPMTEEAYILLSQLLAAQQRYADAIAVCDEYVEITDESAAIFKERGRVKYLSGDKQGAEKDARKAGELGDRQFEQCTGEYRNYVPKTDALGLSL